MQRGIGLPPPAKFVKVSKEFTVQSFCEVTALIFRQVFCFFPLPVFVWLLALVCKTGYVFEEMILWFDHEGLCIHVLRARENLTKWSCKSLVSQDCCLALLWKTPHCAFSIAQRIWKVRQFRQSESSRSQMHASEVHWYFVDFFFGFICFLRKFVFVLFCFAVYDLD